jgi:CRISPR-associated protein Cas2
MDHQFIVVVYDISDDKRRTKLHNALMNYGSPVQYSVFECLLKDENVDKMKAHVERVIHERQDRVRYYYLCQACLAKTEVTSGPEVLHKTDVIVI